MIHSDPSTFLESIAAFRDMRPLGRATMQAAALVSPLEAHFSEDSASDNYYMNSSATMDLVRAREQHHLVADKLGELGLPVILFQGRQGLHDGVFPNNVFATARRKLVVGSMRHASRRREARRHDIRLFFEKVMGYGIVDLSELDLTAELTGSLVIDRKQNIGFCGISGRADHAGCEAMSEAFGLDHVLRFDLAPAEYHTNIVLSVLAGRACILHPPSIMDSRILEALNQLYGGRVLVLTDAEKSAFAGNCLAATERDVLLSATSLKGLRTEAVEQLQGWGFDLHPLDVDEFEKGGGSLRCLIAEVF